MNIGIMCKESNILRVINIVDGTSVDGPGLRTSIYFAGCHHRCPGCHNPSTWDPNGGQIMTIAEILHRIKANDLDVTFSGGDPLFQVDTLITLAQLINTLGKKIWLYTGYTFDEIIKSHKLSPIIPYTEVIVDGPFIETQKDTSLIFKGSANQRLIDVKHWLKTGEIKNWESDF